MRDLHPGGGAWLGGRSGAGAHAPRHRRQRRCPPGKGEAQVEHTSGWLCVCVVYRCVCVLGEVQVEHTSGWLCVCSVPVGVLGEGRVEQHIRLAVCV